MPNGLKYRIAPLLHAIASIAILVFWTHSVWSSEGLELGVVKQNHEFAPIARVVQHDSVIQFIKVRSDEKFRSVRIKFVFPGVDKPGALRDIFIQWEKKPGKMGRQWPLDRHKGTDLSTHTFRAAWTRSLSFVLIDKRKKSRFRGRKWDEVVQVSLEGKKLAEKPPPEKKVEIAKPVSAPERAPEPEPIVEESVPGPAVALRPSIETRGPGTGPRHLPLDRPQLSPAVIAPVSGVDMSGLKALDRKCEQLAQRLSKLERAVLTTQRWFYWGPLLALTFSVLFSTVAIFFTYTRLSRDQEPRGISPSRLSDVRLQPHGKFRDVG